MSREDLIKVADKLEEKYLKQASISDIIHMGLDVLGFIPGLGEAFDAGNMAFYLAEQEYTWALMSLISMIPEVGDVIGKGGKVVEWFLSKGFTVESMISKFGVKACQAIKRLVLEANLMLLKYRGPIGAMIKGLERDPVWAKYSTYAPFLQKALENFITDFNKVAMVWQTVDFASTPDDKK